MHRSITWIGCDLISGDKIEELPDLTSDGPLESIIATASSLKLTMPLGDTTRDWQAATAQGRTMIVPLLSVTNDTGATLLDQVPAGAYIPLLDEAGSASTLQFAAVSLEGYLDRRYVADHAWAGQDESSVILAGLFADANVEGIGFAVTAAATGQLSDATYFAGDDKTVYSAARELMGRLNGPEWLVSVEWVDPVARTAIRKLITAGPRVGNAAATPAAMFTTAGESATTYTVTRDFSAGKGANDVLAESSGQGETRPQSQHARDEVSLASGWPRWEHRFTPSTSISDTDTLDAHAAAALVLMRRGARTITLTARLDADPIWSKDWRVGDDIAYDLIGPGHPDGLVGVGRCIGARLNLAEGTASPILLAPGEEVI